jgi:opine dehydrogenase
MMVKGEKDIRFTVIGAGAGGRAMAAHLSILGYTTNLLNRSEEGIRDIKTRGGIKVSGLIEGFTRIDKATTDPEEALENTKVVMVIVPAYAHREIAKTIAHYLNKGQIIVLNPGRTGGAIEFANILKTENIKTEVIIAETQTILHTCRVIGDEVRILAVKDKVPLSAFPSINTDEVMAILSGVSPRFVKAEDVLQTGLGNIGCILHPMPTLLNIVRIEAPGTQFKHYYEGITVTVSRLLELLDRERIAVAQSLGVEVLSTREWLYEAYGSRGKTLHEALLNNEYYRTIDAPDTIHHRYLLEDVPTGLVPISSLGTLAGVNTPIMDQIISLASLACNVDFKKTGRTVESLRIDGMSREELKKLVRYGYPK